MGHTLFAALRGLNQQGLLPSIAECIARGWSDDLITCAMDPPAELQHSTKLSLLGYFRLSNPVPSPSAVCTVYVHDSRLFFGDQWTQQMTYAAWINTTAWEFQKGFARPPSWFATTRLTLPMSKLLLETSEVTTQLSAKSSREVLQLSLAVSIRSSTNAERSSRSDTLHRRRRTDWRWLRWLSQHSHG